MRPTGRLLEVLLAMVVTVSASASFVPPYRDEPLLEASADTIRWTGGMLDQALERGERDMDAYTQIARMLLQHALQSAERHPGDALEYRRAALRISYNLAANTWPGWAGAPEIDERQRVIGLEAAKLAAHLSIEAAQNDERRFNHSWMLGAHLIAAGNHAEAITAFETCQRLVPPHDRERQAMAQGWIHVANIVAGKNDREALTEVERQLSEMGESGAYWSAQFAPAIAAFTKGASQ